MTSTSWLGELAPLTHELSIIMIEALDIPTRSKERLIYHHDTYPSLSRRYLAVMLDTLVILAGFFCISTLFQSNDPPSCMCG